MTDFYKAVNNGCRMAQEPGQKNNVSDSLGIIFLEKQKSKIGRGTERVKQNRNNDQNFHYPALIKGLLTPDTFV